MVSSLIGLAIIAGYFTGAAFTARAVYAEAVNANWGRFGGPGPGLTAVLGGLLWPVAGVMIFLFKFAKAPTDKVEAERVKRVAELNERISVWHDLSRQPGTPAAEVHLIMDHVREMRAERQGLQR